MPGIAEPGQANFNVWQRHEAIFVTGLDAEHLLWLRLDARTRHARTPAPDPSVVERDLSKPYVPEPVEITSDGGAP